MDCSISVGRGNIEEGDGDSVIRGAAKEVDYGLGAFGDWTARNSELDEVSYGKLKEQDERVYTHKAFTKGFMIGRELYLISCLVG